MLPLQYINNLNYPFYNEIDFKDYSLLFLYDKNWDFIWILVDWENRADITKEILNCYCPDEVEIYNSDELNIKLLDLIFNNI